MRRVLFAAGLILYLLSGFLGICLIGAFIVCTFQWNFGRWWFWPLAALACLTLAAFGHFITFASRYDETKNDPLYQPFGIPTGYGTIPARIQSPQLAKPYRWGKTQGWITIASSLFVIPASFRPGAIIGAVLLVAAGTRILLLGIMLP